MMSRQAALQSPELAQTFSLPFALTTGPPPAPPAEGVLGRLNSLERLAMETRDSVQRLLRDSSDILRVLAEPSETAAPASDLETRSLLAESSHDLNIRLFGGCEVSDARGATVSWKNRKARSLLAYLALEPRRVVAKDVLIDLFWPDSPAERGSNNLSIAIFQIRSALKPFISAKSRGIVVQQGLYRLDPDVSCWVDVHEFQERISQARATDLRQDREKAREHFVEATAIARGSFLEHDLYEEWTVEPRRAYDANIGRAFAWLASDAEVDGDWKRLIDYASQILARDLCDEDAYRWLMTAEWRLGNRAKALQQYEACVERLQEELGVAPSERLRDLFLAIKGEGTSFALD